MDGKSQGLISGFIRSSAQFPQRLAVRVGDAELSYEALRALSTSIADTLRQTERQSDRPPLTAVFAYRSVTAFAGILGALFQGHGYVPLNPTFPVARSRRMLESAGCQYLIVDELAAAQLCELLEDITHPLCIVLPELEDIEELARRLPMHR